MPIPRGMYSWPSRASSSATCFTKGQWLQMNIITVPCSPATSRQLSVRPLTSSNAKSGAGVPRGSIVLGVRTISFSLQAGDSSPRLRSLPAIAGRTNGHQRTRPVVLTSPTAGREQIKGVCLRRLCGAAARRQPAPDVCVHAFLVEAVSAVLEDPRTTPVAWPRPERGDG